MVEAENVWHSQKQNRIHQLMTAEKKNNKPHAKSENYTEQSDRIVQITSGKARYCATYKVMNCPRILCLKTAKTFTDVYR